jgi:hypothetical protein
MRGDAATARQVHASGRGISEPGMPAVAAASIRVAAAGAGPRGSPRSYHDLTTSALRWRERGGRMNWRRFQLTAQTSAASPGPAGRVAGGGRVAANSINLACEGERVIRATRHVRVEDCR